MLRIFRLEICSVWRHNQTEMGVLAKSYIDKGELVPASFANGIVKERLHRTTSKKQVLVGCHLRTIEQAHALTKPDRA